MQEVSAAIQSNFDATTSRMNLSIKSYVKVARRRFHLYKKGSVFSGEFSGAREVAATVQGNRDRQFYELFSTPRTPTTFRQLIAS